MTTYFVTRHVGAQAWAQEQGFDGAIVISNFDPTIVKEDDIVMGILPMHLAAEVCRRGGKYYNLAMAVPPDARGKELTSEMMNQFGARLVQYKIQEMRR